MSAHLVVERKIMINALPERVWEVLVKPRYIRRWEDLPKGLGNKTLELESVIRWDQEEDQFIELTVTAFEPGKLLRLALFHSEWDSLPADPITYTYQLISAGARTRLILHIGDFRPLEDGLEYYEESVVFARNALRKIKEISEETEK